MRRGHSSNPGRRIAALAREENAMVKAIDTAARLATLKITLRWESEGFKAPVGAINPYRAGTHAHTCWQHGYDTKQTGSTS